MAKVRVGLIGPGARLRGVVKLLIDQAPEVQVTALCDPNPGAIDAARKLAAPDARVYDDYRQLVADDAVDWVMIGSFNCQHREHAVAALEAGKHGFCEKPLATTLEDALAIRDALARTDRQFVIGFTLRYTPHYRRIKKLIDDGRIGRIISFEFNETLEFNHGGFIHADWRRLTRHAGTHLLEKCCHDVDIVNWCTGSLATRAASFGGNDFFIPDNAHHAQRIGPNPANGRPAYQNWPTIDLNPFTTDRDIVDNQVAIVEFANRVRATFHTNCNAGLPERRLYLCGSEGTIRADLITGQIELRRIGWDEPTTIYTSIAGGHGGGDEVMTRELADCMLHHHVPATTLDDGLKSAITCFGIDQAMTTGEVVDLRPLWHQAGIDIPDLQPQGAA